MPENPAFTAVYNFLGVPGGQVKFFRKALIGDTVYQTALENGPIAFSVPAYDPLVYD